MSPPNRSLPIIPSRDTPWDVRVVSVVPKKVHEELEKRADNDSPVVGAVVEGWAAILLHGKVFVWHLTDSLDAPKNVHVLYHAKMATTSTMQISITATNANNNNSGDVVFVSAASSDGHVYLWKLSKQDRGSLPRSPQARVALRLGEGEAVSALASLGNVLIVGTNQNSLWWCTPTSHPIMLHAQKVERQEGFLKKIMYGSKATQQEAIHSIEILSPHVFLAISASGNVEQWKATTTIASSHQATFEGEPVASLKSLFHTMNSSISTIQVMRTTLSQRCLDFILLVNTQKVYWVRGTITQTCSLKLEKVEWINRFHPEVKCVGLVSTHGRVAYACFQYDNKAPVTCIAFSSSSSFGISEVDMPETEVPLWIEGTLGRDVVTHGTWGLATSGLGIRTRFLQGKRDDSSQVTSAVAPVVNTLAKHLRSAFWQWYQHGGTFRLPPSIIDASPQDLEPAIILTARYLRVHETSSKHNPTEWHNAFLTMLQQGGLYRSISQQGRWALLGIGQELAVYQALHSKLPGLQADSVSKALAESRDFRTLSLALSTANKFRKEFATSRYDVMPGQSPSHRVWTGDSTLQAVMWRQLEEWTESPDSLPTEHVKTVVTTILDSHREASDPKTYEEVKELAIPLIRKIHSDHLAFELAKEHSWNNGLCQLARDHEKEAEYNLDSLMQSRGDNFCDYVLGWHAEKGLPAHVLNYGRNCPERLAAFLEKDDRLRQYRWIAAVRAKQFDQASDLLIESESSSLGETRRALSIAKLCSRKRRKLVDRQLELVQAQKMLLGEDLDEALLSPDRLLSVALSKLELATHLALEDKVETAVIALAIAGASDDRIRLAAQVWSECISADRERWMDWLQTQDDMENPQLRENIIKTTLFGQLWNAVQGGHDEEVCYGNAMDNLVLERLGVTDALGAMQMRRLLNFVTTPGAE
jgi:hypothetical protein